MNKTIIPDADVSVGFELNEAILEAIDDILDNVPSSTEIEVIVDDYKNQFFYIIADQAGGLDIENIFSIKQGRKLEDRFNNFEEFKKKSGKFSAGSRSHLNISNNVYLITKKDGQLKVLRIYKDFETLDFIKEEIEYNAIEDYYLELLNSKLSQPLSSYDTVLFATDVNIDTQESIDVFSEKKNFLGLEKNLRSTYYYWLKNNYNIKLNGKSLAPLDLFYLELKNNYKIAFNFAISLQDLFIQNPYFRKEIITSYLPLYTEKYGSKAMDMLLSESIKITGYIYDTNYFNNTYFKDHPEDEITFKKEIAGIWLLRNNRVIGNPQLLPFQNTTHNDWNGLRVKVEFCPVFDKFMGIQTNKNRSKINKTFSEVFLNRLNEIYMDAPNKYTTELKNEIKNFESNKDMSNDLPVKKKAPQWEEAKELIYKWLLKQNQKSPNQYAEIVDARGKRLGFDFKYKDYKGETILIDVTKIQFKNQKFLISKDEYPQAYKYEENYQVFLVLLLENKAQVLILKNLFKNATISPHQNSTVSNYTTSNQFEIEY